MGKSRDNYVNMIDVSVAQTVINTTVFEEIKIGVSLYDKVAVRVERLEYYPANVAAEVQAATDTFRAGITQSNQLATMSPEERAIVDVLDLGCSVAAGAGFVRSPFVRDFRELSGGGILVSPQPIYLGLQTAGYIGLEDVTARMYFTLIELSDSEFFELMESRRYYG